MARVYRDGLEAIRSQFSRRLAELDEREAELSQRAGTLLPKTRLSSLKRLRARLDIDLDDLDALVDADDALIAYERSLRACADMVDELRAEQRRLAPLRKAMKVLSLLLVAVTAMVVVGFYRQQDQQDQALADHQAKCHESLECKNKGECSARRSEGHLLWCTVAGDDDCAPSTGCIRDGACSARDGRCVAADDADCRDAMVCKLLAQCSASFDRCIASDDAACRATSGCSNHGRCRAVDGECQAPLAQRESPPDDRCADQPGCIFNGRCQRLEGRCVVGSNRDCASSTFCDQKGLCLRDGERCVADAASCLQSLACKEAGQCRAESGACVE